MIAAYVNHITRLTNILNKKSVSKTRTSDADAVIDFKKFVNEESYNYLQMVNKKDITVAPKLEAAVQTQIKDDVKYVTEELRDSVNKFFGTVSALFGKAKTRMTTFRDKADGIK